MESLPDFRSPDVDVFEIGHLSVPVCDRDGGHLAVHVVLGFNEAASVDLAGDGFARHDVALGLKIPKIKTLITFA
jgi:hypothetical protein